MEMDGSINEILTCQLNDKENTTYQIYGMWQEVLGGKFTSLNAYIRKQDLNH